MLIENLLLLSDIRCSKYLGVILFFVGFLVYEWKLEVLGVLWMVKFNIIFIFFYIVCLISYVFRIEILDLVRS